MKLTARQSLLFEWVKIQHGNQIRKYTGEPYWNHLWNVAVLADEYSIHLGVEISLCHDLIEDTPCKIDQLLSNLAICGYDNNESIFITSCVNDLTDVYTHREYSKLNRKRRKELERERMRHIHPISQSIKYCDIIDNSSSISKHDHHFWEVYSNEVSELLNVMSSGDSELNLLCRSVLLVCNYQPQDGSGCTF